MDEVAKAIDIGITDVHGRKYLWPKVANYTTREDTRLLVLFKTFDWKNDIGDVLAIYNLDHVLYWEII